MENANIKLGDEYYVAALCFCVKTKLDFDCAKLARLIATHIGESGVLVERKDYVLVPCTYQIYIPSYCKPEAVVDFLAGLEGEIESALDNIDVLKVLKRGLATRR